MKNFLTGVIYALLLALSIPAQALNVSGPISSDTTWLAANTPYVVTGNVLVHANTTLTIEPDVEVRLDPGVSIQINGELIAQGTFLNRITFTKNHRDDHWGFLLFEDSSVDATYDLSGGYLSGSILEYVTIEYGGTDNGVYSNAALRLESSSPYINSSHIKNSANHGIYGIGNGSPELRITNSLVEDNHGLGIMAFSFPSISIVNNFIRGNSTGGADLRTSGGKVSVLDNRIENNGANCTDNLTCMNASGLYVNSSIPSSVINNVIKNNIAGRGVGGVVIKSRSSLVKNNIVVGNSGRRAGGMMDESGASVEANIIARNYAFQVGGLISNHGIHLSRNIISDNLTKNDLHNSLSGGVYLNVDKGATVEYNQISGNEASQWSAIVANSHEPMEMENNTIVDNRSGFVGANTDTATIISQDAYHQSVYSQNNIFRNMSEFELFNDVDGNRLDIDAADNWWGSSEESYIQSKLYDFLDDSTKSIVFYSPYLTTMNEQAPISPPSGLVVTPNAGSLDVTWNANPESDVAGYKVYWGTEDAPFYENVVDVGSVTHHNITGLGTGTQYIGVTAYDNDYDATADIASTITNDNMTDGHESWFARETANPVTVGDGGHDFGEVYTGLSAQQELTVSNLSDDSLTVDSVTLLGYDAVDFAIGSDDCTGISVAAGQSCTFVVVFAPVLEGSKSAYADVSVDGDMSIEVTLTGIAVAVGDLNVDTTDIQFGPLRLGESEQSQLMVDNIGTAALGVGSITLAGEHSAEFSVTHDCDSLPASSSCSLMLDFTPVSAGLKSATLTITTDDPDESSIVISLSANAFSPLSIVYLSTEAATGTAPLATGFTVTATGGSGDYQYQWDFGDGDVSSSQNPSHTFLGAGIFQVQASVIDTADSANTATSHLTVKVIEEPVADSPLYLANLTANVSSGMAPLDVNFSATPLGGSGSYNYSWVFDDGETSTLNSPSHRFTDAGVYSVSVTVTDINDADKTTVGELNIRVVSDPDAYSPVGIAALNASRSTGPAPMDVEFDVHPSGGTGDYLYSWDFGDGSDIETSRDPSHLFGTAGTYTVQLSVSDANDVTNLAVGELTVTVVEEPPPYSPVVIDTLGASEVAGTAPMDVDFTVSASGGSGSYIYQWNFDGVEDESGSSPTHRFSAAGSYPVTVTITDTHDRSNVATGNLTVLVVDVPVSLGVAFDLSSSSSGEAPHTVNLLATITGGSGPYTLEWDFGDGQFDSVTASNGTSGISHTYQDAGHYEIGLTAIAQGGVGVQKMSIQAISTINVVAAPDPGESSNESEEGAVKSSSGGSLDVWLMLTLLLPLGFLLKQRFV